MLFFSFPGNKRKESRSTPNPKATALHLVRSATALKPQSTVIAPQRPACCIQHSMGILEPFRLYLEAAPQVPTRLISHVPHFSRVGKLPGSHRDHFVAVGLKRHPFRGITRYLRRRQVFRIRIVLDHQPYFPVTHVGNKRLATGNATSPFARPDSTIDRKSVV